MKYESPDRKVSDYSRVRCDGDIWKNQNDETNANGLYWLRLISCARTFTPTQARVQSYGYDSAKWDGAFKRAILLARLEQGNAERRSALEQLKNVQANYPESVYPLAMMWRSEQLIQATLQDERGRAQRQKESAEAQIIELQLQMADTKHQLHETTRKLQNLTDIERQLSSRKMTQGEGITPISPLPPENPEGNASAAAGDVSGSASTAAPKPNDENGKKATEKPAETDSAPAVKSEKKPSSSASSEVVKPPEKPAVVEPQPVGVPEKPATVKPQPETTPEKPVQSPQSTPSQSEAAPQTQTP